MLTTTSEPASLGDIELGENGSASKTVASNGGVVSLSAKDMYVDVVATTAAERAAMGVPACLTGGCVWAGWFTGCCLLTVLLPLAVLLPLGLGPKFLPWIIVAVGVAWVLFSLRRTLWEGGLAMPAAPPRATAFTAPAPSAGRSPPKKLYVVVNPHGGVKKGVAALEQVVLPVWRDEFGIEVTVLKTEYAGHARVYASTVDLEGYDGICVIGGDGSYHEVANGLLQRPPGSPLVPIGILPGGSGNSVMLDLGCWSLKEAARRIGRGDVMKVDVNKVTTGGKSVASVNMVAWGLVGDVGVVAEGFRCLGPSRYDAVAVWGVAKGGGWPCKLDFQEQKADGSTQQQSLDQNLLTAFVMCTQHFGKGLRPTPDARLDDGLMDLAYLDGRATRGEMLAIFNMLPTGAHKSGAVPGINMKQVKSCTIDVGQPGVVNIDGECLRHDGKLEFEMLEKRLEIFCPATYDALAPGDAEASKKADWA